MGKRIVYVIVAGGAMDRHPHEGSPHGGDPIDDVLEKALLGQCGSAVNDEVQAIESRGHELVARRLGKQVAGQLIADEVIVAQVLVESPNYPIAISNQVAVKVLVHTVGVSKTDQVQPVTSKMLTILLLGQ